MTAAAEVLAAWQAAADAATPADLWRHEDAYGHPGGTSVRIRIRPHEYAAAFTGTEPNAAFIALSRDALPRAVAALRAVLDLHVPDPTVHALDPWEKGHRAALLNAHAAITAALGVTP